MFRSQLKGVGKSQLEKCKQNPLKYAVSFESELQSCELWAVLQSAFSPVLTVTSRVLWCVRGTEAQILSCS